MKKQTLKSKVLVIILLLLALTVSSSSNAFAWGGGHGGGHYRYHGGGWHDDGWFWGFFATGLVAGAIVATLPPRYETVYVSGEPYYYYDNVYYRPAPNGYLVVPAPTTTIVTAPAVVAAPVAPAVVAAPVVMQPRVISGQSVVINIPNISGGYTPVTLTQYKTGYIGPQGEYYEGHPSVEQLKVLYGR